MHDALCTHGLVQAHTQMIHRHDASALLYVSKQTPENRLRWVPSAGSCARYEPYFGMSRMLFLRFNLVPVLVQLSCVNAIAGAEREPRLTTLKENRP